MNLGADLWLFTIGNASSENNFKGLTNARGAPFGGGLGVDICGATSACPRPLDMPAISFCRPRT